MIATFLLVVYLGNAKVSANTYFYSIDRCQYFAKRISKQASVPPRKQKYVAVCEIKHVDPKTVRIYK